MQKGLPVRKRLRLKEYEYSSAGCYFITICIKDRHEMLGEIVGRDVLIAPDTSSTPRIVLSKYGNIANKHINKIAKQFTTIIVDKYVIMPNHIHMILAIPTDGAQNGEVGAMKTSRPTSASISSLIRSFKTMVTKELGFSMWQSSYHDRIIRDENEYQRIWQYIDENPARWREDCYFSKHI